MRGITVTPAKRQQVMEDWLRGTSINRLADSYKLSVGVIHKIVTEARRDLQTSATRTAEEVLAEVALLRAEAWKKYQESTAPITKDSIKRVFVKIGKAFSDEEARAVGGVGRKKGRTLSISGAVEHTVQNWNENRPGDPTWLHIVQWCLEFESKLRGLTAPLHVTHEFRVAGLAPDELDGEMFSRLADVLQRRGAKPVDGKVIDARIADDADRGGNGGRNGGTKNST